MTYTFKRFTNGKCTGVVSAKANNLPEAIDKISQPFNGVFLLIRKV